MIDLIMRSLACLFVLLCVCGSAHGQYTTHTCDRVVGFKHINATGPVEVVPAVTGQRIYFCGAAIIQKGNTLSLQIMTGTGTNCSTNTVLQTPVLEFPNDVAVVTHQDFVGIASDPGVALCIQTSGSNGKLGGLLYYAQL